MAMHNFTIAWKINNLEANKVKTYFCAHRLLRVPSSIKQVSGKVYGLIKKRESKENCKKDMPIISRQRYLK